MSTTAKVAALVLRTFTADYQLEEQEIGRYNSHEGCFMAMMAQINQGKDAQCRTLGSTEPGMWNAPVDYIYGYGARQPDYIIRYEYR